MEICAYCGEGAMNIIFNRPTCDDCAAKLFGQVEAPAGPPETPQQSQSMKKNRANTERGG